MNKVDRNIVLLNFAFFFKGLVFLSPIMLLFYKANGLWAGEFFFFQGIFYLTAILTELPIGFMADFFSRKSMLMTSVFLLLFNLLLWYFFEGYFIVLLGEIVLAISKVFLDTSNSTYLYEYLVSKGKEKNMSGYFGGINFYLSLSTSIAMILGTYLYMKIGIKNVILAEIVAILICIFLLSFLPRVDSVKKQGKSFKEIIYVIKSLFQDERLKFYVLFSGILMATSLFFATSLQPLMVLVNLPVAVFGFVSFANHFTRALTVSIAAKFSSRINIKVLAVVVYLFFVGGFLAIFKILSGSKMDILLLIFLCFAIGVQLLFLIIHVSRLNSLIQSENRALFNSVNSFIARLMSAIMLLSTVFFVDKTHLFYATYFVAFVIISTPLLLKIRSGK